MKNFRLIMLFFTGFFFSFMGHAAETFSIDSQHSYVLWHIKHFGFSTQVGKVYASGTLVLDQQAPQKSKVNATLRMADMVTGVPELDQHLKGQLFFNVNQFPTATFASDKVVIHKNSAQVHGTLTLHGIARPVILFVKLNQMAPSPLTDLTTVGFSANTQIKRSDFGITTLLPGLGDEVALDIELEAYKPHQ